MLKRSTSQSDLLINEPRDQFLKSNLNITYLDQADVAKLKNEQGVMANSIELGQIAKNKPLL